MITGKALVTGGAGFIGSHLVDRLIENGWEVSVIDDFSTGYIGNIGRHLGNKRFKLIKGSILDKEVLRSGLADAEYVFHLAAIASVRSSISDPELADEVNIHGTAKLLNYARLGNVRAAIFASSAAVYGSAYRPPLTEDLLPQPDSPYGVTKLAGEEYCRAFSKTYGLSTIVLRYFNVYGPRCRTGQYAGVLMAFARRLESREPLVIFGDGRQTRDFVHVDDVVGATLRAAISKPTPGDIFNVGTGKGTSINELARVLLRENGSPRWNVTHESPKKGEITHSWASVARARRILGFASKTSLSAGIRSFLSWRNASLGE